MHGHLHKTPQTLITQYYGSLWDMPSKYTPKHGAPMASVHYKCLLLQWHYLLRFLALLSPFDPLKLLVRYSADPSVKILNHNSHYPCKITPWLTCDILARSRIIAWLGFIPWQRIVHVKSTRGGYRAASTCVLLKSMMIKMNNWRSPLLQLLLLPRGALSRSWCGTVGGRGWWQTPYQRSETHRGGQP